MSISPAVGTLYAGVPARFILLGGRKPYTLTSSEPGLLPVPTTITDNFVDVIPNNPGVVDPNLKPEDLPRRTVTLTLRDSTGGASTATIQVAQNFLTGYGLVLTAINCPTPATGTTTACAGGTTAARLSAVFNGNLAGNRQFRLEALRGNFTVRDPATGRAGNSITVTSDHTGAVIGIIEVPAGVPTQLAVIRVTDVATGVYSDQIFVITAVVIPPTPAPPPRIIVPIPSTIKFTGPNSTICGSGLADILLFDGLPPYMGLSPTNAITILNSPSNSQPGRITLQVNSCVDAPVVFTDSSGARTQVQVTSVVGALDPAKPPDFTIGATTLTLACGATGSISIIGGSGNYAITSTNANVTAFVSGNSLSITRAKPDLVGSGGVPGGNSTISITDGAKIITVTVNSPLTC